VIPFHVKNRQDFYGGLLFAAFGIFGVYFGRSYAVGTIIRMGPGYLPKVLSYALIIIGAYVAIKAIRFGDSTIEQCRWRPIIFVLGSIVVFAFLIVKFGLVLSILLVTFLSSFGTREARWMGSAILGAFMALLTTFLFIYLLGLPIQVWPR
jgi:hypothetical protein